MKIVLMQRPYSKPGYHGWRLHAAEPGLEIEIIDATQALDRASELGQPVPLWRIEDLLQLIDGTITMQSVLAGMPEVFAHLKNHPAYRSAA